MLAHNTCYSTLVTNKVNFLKTYKESDLEESPVEFDDGRKTYFVKHHVKLGILPEILEELLQKRDAAKAELKVFNKLFEDLDKEYKSLKEKGGFAFVESPEGKELEKKRDEADNSRKVYDGRQLALKITANSIYGGTGAKIGKLPCLEIAGTVTAWGRIMLYAIRDFVEETYNKAHGYPIDSEVIAGDTDSIMILMRGLQIAEAMQIAKGAAKAATDFIKKKFNLTYSGDRTNLDFEKVYCPYLLIKKKRYAGLWWTKADKYDKLDMKGIESTRRDNCKWASGTQRTAIEMILIKGDIEGAKQLVRNAVSDIRNGRIDISDLVISKSYSKDAKEYKSTQPHIELAKKMAIRDPGSAPGKGSRVPYIKIAAGKNAKSHEKYEDPLYVIRNDVPIDDHYYLHNQLKKPIMRVFKAIMEDPESLINGEHSLIVTKKIGNQHGIAKFAIQYQSCLQCNTIIKGNDSNQKDYLCNTCLVDEPVVYNRFVKKQRELELEYSRYWTNCQRCQGSLTQEVICGNDECPMFYRRLGTREKLSKVEKKIAMFDKWNNDSMEW
jgi:DNA polymerase delta subunit 1